MTVTTSNPEILSELDRVLAEGTCGWIGPGGDIMKVLAAMLAWPEGAEIAKEHFHADSEAKGRALIQHFLADLPRNVPAEATSNK